MKKLLFSLMSLMLCGFMAQAQFTGTISGQILDANQQPVAGVAVFSYGLASDHGGSFNLNVDKEDYEYSTYTDSNGDYTLGFGITTTFDTVVVGVLDCQKNVVTSMRHLSSSQPNLSNINLQISCVPSDCDALVALRYSYNNPATGYSMFEYEAVSLRDSLFTGLNLPVTHTWTYNNITRSGQNTWQGPNRDTLIIHTINNQPPPSPICYQRVATATCTQNCIGNGPNLNCQADFYVDTVNSINFQGQVVIWENSTTSSGNIIGYRWNFGDGNTSNVQYPIHTYNDTGVYNVCLTIVSVDGTDTCASTFCDSIGFDANGNLIYKKSGQGFTINVIDPATIGQKEEMLPSEFSLFPNPSQGEALLSWDASLNVRQVDVVSISGELVRRIQPTASSVQFNSLKTGVYIVRIQSESGVTAKKMVVH